MPYPSNIDAFSTKVDGVTDVLAADINNLQVTVSGLQTKVGITNSGDGSSLDHKARYVAQNGDARGFQTNAGGWAFYSNNSGQLWSANYGWLHDAFAVKGTFHHTVSVTNCGTTLSATLSGNNLALQLYTAACSDCACACGW
jgi:hypothetical protein